MHLCTGVLVDLEKDAGSLGAGVAEDCDSSRVVGSSGPLEEQYALLAPEPF